MAGRPYYRPDAYRDIICTGRCDRDSRKPQGGANTRDCRIAIVALPDGGYPLFDEYGYIKQAVMWISQLMDRIIYFPPGDSVIYISRKQLLLGRMAYLADNHFF